MAPYCDALDVKVEGSKPVVRTQCEVAGYINATRIIATKYQTGQPGVCEVTVVRTRVVAPGKARGEVAVMEAAHQTGQGLSIVINIGVDFGIDAESADPEVVTLVGKDCGIGQRIIVLPGRVAEL